MGRDLPRGIESRTYPSGKKVLQIEFQYRGVRCRETLSTLSPERVKDVRYAANLKSEIEAKIERGTFNYAEYFPESKRARLFGHATSTKTVKELTDEWLDDVRRSHPHSTVRCYEKSVRTFIDPYLSHYRVADLTPSIIREAIRHRQVTMKTLRNDLTPLRAVINLALQDAILDRNPLDSIDLSRLVSRDKKKSDYEVDPLDLNEINRFLEACREHRPEWVNYWTVAFFTGMRTGELYGLQWDDIDWEEETVAVRRTITEGKEKETKTKAGNRELVLTPMALDALRRNRSVTEMRGPWVFVNPTTGRPLIRYDVTDRCWRFVLKRAGLRYRNQYQTRHSYASNLLSGGENPLFVAQQMGHADTQMIMRTYGKWIEQGRGKRRHVFVSPFGNQGLKKKEESRWQI